MPSSFYTQGYGGTQSAATLENTTARKGRDLDQRGGEWNNTGTTVKNVASTGNLVDVTTGRMDREYNNRKGDVTYSGKILSPGAPKYDADGRNARLYADRTTLVSAMTGDAWSAAATDAGA